MTEGNQAEQAEQGGSRENGGIRDRESPAPSRGQLRRLELRCPCRLFAEEIVKFRFLQRLGGKESGALEEGRLLAFCLLDDSFDMIFLEGGTPGSGPEDPCAYLKGRVLALEEECRARFLTQYGRGSEAREAAAVCECRPVPDAQMLDACIDIHLRPLRKGYVEKLRDYWWSSLQNYADVYAWPLVDTEPVFSRLAELYGAARARERFLKMHRTEVSRDKQ